jgi:hypothetical protein
MVVYWMVLQPNPSDPWLVVPSMTVRLTPLGIRSSILRRLIISLEWRSLVDYLDVVDMQRRPVKMRLTEFRKSANSLLKADRKVPENRRLAGSRIDGFIDTNSQCCTPVNAVEMHIEVTE